VTLGDDIQGVLPELQAAAESMMRDRWVVEKITAGGVLNEDTGEYEGAVVAVYEGPGKFKAANTAVQDVEAGGQLLAVQGAMLSLPVTAVGVREGHVARCVASENDPDLVGVRVRVTGPARGTAITARRFRVEETN